VTLVDRSREVEREAELSRLAAEVKTLAGGLAALARDHSEEPRAENLSALGFTPRQIEILRLAFSGASSKEIGFRLGISESTVKNHLSSIYRKLGVKSKVACIDLISRRRIRIG
jgi:DNA-binding NarL/FixJ family response regulator